MFSRALAKSSYLIWLQLAPVLDCANERQKENFEEAHEAEENRAQEGDTSQGAETS